MKIKKTIEAIPGRHKRYLVSAILMSVVGGCVFLPSLELSQSNEFEPLLDKTLSQWEIWTGVPHSSTKDLPEGTYTAENLNQHGDPSDAIGLNNDVKNVFQMIEQDGEPVLYITGEIYGGLTTIKEYENYHLSLQIKWGEKKWAPRLDKKRDSGLLFHCKGEHGAFWRVWKACQELQIQESDFGDYIPLAGPTGVIRTTSTEPEFKFNPNGQYSQTVTGYSHASLEPDKPNGSWNLVELYTYNDNAVFVVNGEPVMLVEQSKDHKGASLTNGQLQLQSEGAEVFYKDIKIKSIDALPDYF